MSSHYDKFYGIQPYATFINPVGTNHIDSKPLIKEKITR